MLLQVGPLGVPEPIWVLTLRTKADPGAQGVISIPLLLDFYELLSSTDFNFDFWIGQDWDNSLHKRCSRLVLWVCLNTSGCLL